VPVYDPSSAGCDPSSAGYGIVGGNELVWIGFALVADKVLSSMNR